MIRNKTKRNKISSDTIVCRNFFSLFRGLMFRRLGKEQALVLNMPLPSAGSIHTFFVFYPIDVAWLDSNMKVVDIKENIRPFTVMASSRKKAKYVVELPQGKVKRKKIEIGDELNLYTKHTNENYEEKNKYKKTK